MLARAANSGIFIGAYISVLVIASGLNMTGMPMAAIVVWAGSLYLPFFVYRLLRASNAECGFELGFAELWAEGIASFFLGSLVPALLTYLGLRFAAPDLISNIFEQCISTFRAMGAPEWDAWAQSLEHIRDKAGLPTPADVTAQIISFNLMAGMAVSFITAAWLKVRYASPERRRRYLESRHGVGR